VKKGRGEKEGAIKKGKILWSFERKLGGLQTLKKDIPSLGKREAGCGWGKKKKKKGGVRGARYITQRRMILKGGGVHNHSRGYGREKIRGENSPAAFRRPPGRETFAAFKKRSIWEGEGHRRGNSHDTGKGRGSVRRFCVETMALALSGKSTGRRKISAFLFGGRGGEKGDPYMKPCSIWRRGKNSNHKQGARRGRNEKHPTG